MKRLYLVRHAKSSWDEPGLEDHDRPLAARGRRAAKLLARHLRSEESTPELVLCSSAQRATETLERIAPALGADTSVKVERELYGASEGELIERLHAIPDTVGSVMLIGHNPAIQELALILAAGGGEVAEIARKYPTGALATLTFSGAWRELSRGGTELHAFVRPRDLE